MKLRRLIEYEGTADDVRRQVARALLTAQPEIKPGDVVPGFGPILAGRGAPKVVIRLLQEETIP